MTETGLPTLRELIPGPSDFSRHDFFCRQHHSLQGCACGVTSPQARRPTPTDINIHPLHTVSLWFSGVLNSFCHYKSLPIPREPTHMLWEDDSKESDI